MAGRCPLGREEKITNLYCMCLQGHRRRSVVVCQPHTFCNFLLKGTNVLGGKVKNSPCLELILRIVTIEWDSSGFFSRCIPNRRFDLAFKRSSIFLLVTCNNLSLFCPYLLAWDFWEWKGIY